MEGSEVEDLAVDLSFLGARAPFEGIKLQAFPLFFVLCILGSILGFLVPCLRLYELMHSEA